MPKKLIGELLLAKGLISEGQLKIALSKQKSLQQRLGDILVHLDFITREVLEQAVTDGHQSLIEMDVDESLLRLLPESFLKRHQIFPIRQSTDTVWFASPRTERFDIVDDLKFMLTQECVFVLWGEDDINEVLEHHFEKTVIETPVIEVSEDAVLSESDTPINRLVDQIIFDGVKHRASDIHLEPLRDKCRLRYRIDGVLQERPGPPVYVQGAVFSRIKLLSGMNIAEKRLPQDGRLTFKFQKKEVELRVSSLPSSFGESLSLRILDKSKFFLEMDELGLLESDRTLFDHMLGLSHGLILVTGPTGSGKTTTLYSLLSHINASDRKIISVEDPVEYELPGMNQVQVKNEIGLTFSTSLRAILRQAPNVIMVGEIRDSETATMAVQAALTGHLVISTLHTSDAPGAVVRLLDMGIQPYKVASALQVVIAQRLVRRICKNCQDTYQPNEAEQSVLQLDPDTKLYQGAGCPMCLDTGYYGRVGLFQNMVCTESVKELIYQQVSSSQLREHAESTGVLSLQEDAFEKVKLGWTSLEEVMRVTGGEG